MTTSILNGDSADFPMRHGDMETRPRTIQASIHPRQIIHLGFIWISYIAAIDWVLYWYCLSYIPID